DIIKKYATDDVNFLLSKNVKMIISACGTVSSICGNWLEEQLSVPFIGVVAHGSKAATNKTKTKNIGIIGTNATVASGAYEKYIKTIMPQAKIIGKACPLFVPLVENGYTDFENQATRLICMDYLSIMKKAEVDTLILGCTHYGILSPIIGDIMGNNVQLIDVGKETARYAAKLLSDNNLLKENSYLNFSEEHFVENSGNYSFYVSDDVESFSKNASIFLKHPVNSMAKLINIDNFLSKKL
ncbi:MAG: aspartate/glutamate racemase family protein, partial [Clostridia bacterium]